MTTAWRGHGSSPGQPRGHSLEQPAAAERQRAGAQGCRQLVELTRTAWQPDACMRWVGRARMAPATHFSPQRAGGCLGATQHAAGGCRGGAAVRGVVLLAGHCWGLATSCYLASLDGRSGGPSGTPSEPLPPTAAGGDPDSAHLGRGLQPTSPLTTLSIPPSSFDL